MKLKNKNIWVAGLGTTGEAVCRFLLKQGAEVSVTENRTRDELGERADFWRRKGVRLETGGHNLESLLEAELIVMSPGIPDLPVFQEAARRGKKIVSEIELASWFLEGRIAGVTGSNGKSTVASLAQKILKDAGYPAFLAGNIGTPLISWIDKDDQSNIYVTELSSFQLSRVESFSVEAAVILNFSPDHLDWHQTYEKYISSKLNLLYALKPSGAAVLNRDDPLVWSSGKDSPGEVYGFSRLNRLEKGCWIEQGWIHCRIQSEEQIMPVSEIPLTGIHNQENVMSAVLTARIFGADPSAIRKSVNLFKGLEHRMESVMVLDRVEFYNDSKATNVDAVLKSLQSFDSPVILILGGRDKGGDFSRLIPDVKKRGKEIILLGEARGKIRSVLNGIIPIQEADSMREAVEKSCRDAEPGDIVLLSPGCTSFDMFESFEHRGKVFKQEVRNLKPERRKR
jgi:UDP-N-acetylmuramoylalanine--D-glutamate ligase